MNRIARLTALAALAAAPAVVLHAQGRGGQNWNTTAADAQRTGWLRTETRISTEAMKVQGAKAFQLLWKAKPENQPRQLNTLTQPLILATLISHKGFKSLTFFGGSGDVVYAYDYDLAKVYWSQKLNTASTTAGTPACPGGLTTITRATPLAQSAIPGRGGTVIGGPGRRRPPASTRRTCRSPARSGRFRAAAWCTPSTRTSERTCARRSG